jgi:pyruvate kinase
MSGKTKIVCTIGPASGTEQQLSALIEAGMDVARLNFSHGTHEDHLAILRHLHAAMQRTGKHIAVLQDLQGPKIRIGELQTGHVQLVTGGQVSITTEQVAGSAERLPTSYRALPQDVRPGEVILLDDGKLRLRVTEVRGNDVICTVTVGGMLSSHKGMNLPGTSVNAPSLTDKDLRDLAFGIAHEVDHIALSFVRSADDLRALRDAMAGLMPKGSFLPIIAKIEKPQAVTNIDEIIAMADGIMVARGDLGVEMPPEEVPVLQKMIIRKCNAVGKPVIIATQMLESMINNPSPTRAEASDVANAVVDGTDAVMLSGETSIGKYPVDAVGMMERIIQRVEAEHIAPWHAAEGMSAGVEGRVDALGRAACVLAEQMNAAAIVVVTRSGETARVISRYRPRTPIVAITDSTKILRRLGLVWGVRGMIAEGLNDSSDKALHRIQHQLLASGLVQAGAFVVLLGGQPFLARGSTNFIKITQIE